ncbi:GDP-mannose 4,6-dehydratase [Candidatus Kaiserbacteria bacterium RIFCSPHIGHO2_02_FULL_49_11]|uniref:GDP-mannose 4,6-dehydratase n=1 Tax=Candidatus Kaiserbacteria bacterium RIFCSPHIGHO2_02_FULL_49_11 TaxID=1798489 RepID=A0A1F6D0V2_9BACT|nr:MAG: GDP-mannose 4,6-dehydratase [Candidatus Kaiserbacteria bacterium RIFCSPHIGHO2_02_FULL_49_11]
MKRALITGITGQDGSYLAEYLINEGYEVWGLMRRTSLDPLMRINDLAVSRRIKITYGNLRDSASLLRALQESQPDEIYNLAAQSDVGISFKCPEETMEINYLGLGRLVNEAVKVSPKVRIYQASTSEMFGKTLPPQNESSAFAPVSPYGESKLKAHEDFVKGYRERHGIYICSGILFNHESPRRGEHFVTRKITISLAKIKLGLQDSFSLGNLEAKRDWGFAGDYVRAMHLILQQDTPDDYVVASGEARSVRDFVEAGCKALGMRIFWSGDGLDEVGKDENGKTILTIKKEFYRPTEVDYLLGDCAKARQKLRWTPEVSFDALVAMMAGADIEKARREAGLVPAMDSKEFVA